MIVPSTAQTKKAYKRYPRLAAKAGRLGSLGNCARNGGLECDDAMRGIDKWLRESEGKEKKVLKEGRGEDRECSERAKVYRNLASKLILFASVCAQGCTDKCESATGKSGKEFAVQALAMKEDLDLTERSAQQGPWWYFMKYEIPPRTDSQ